MKEFDKFIEEAAAKRCPPGKYYDGNKCVIPPRGFHVGRGGYMEPDDSKNGNGKKNGSTANGNSNGGSGNGNGGNGNGGNGGGGNGG